MPHLDAGYNLARWLTRNASDADDVVQDACVRALKYVGTLRDGDARAWFLTIVRHAFYDWCKRNRPAEIVRDDGTAHRDVPSTIAGRRPRAARRAQCPTRRCWPRPSPRCRSAYREVLVLRELEELSYKEIARVVDLPVGTVMSRLARARGLLQRSPLLHAIRGRTSGGDR